MKSFGFSGALFLLLLCALMASCFAPTNAAKPTISATNPASLAVNVGAGEVQIPSGRKVVVAPARISFDPPEIREFTGHHKGQVPDAPNNYETYFERIEPWPTDPAKLIEFSPRSDEGGTLILGTLFRAFQEDSLRVTSQDGAKTYERGVDFVFNADTGQIANKDGRLSGKITATVKGALQRLDLVQVGADGKVSVKKGRSALVSPVLPQPDAGAAALAGIYIAPWRMSRNPHYDKTPQSVAGASEYAITPSEILPIANYEPAPLVQPGGVAKTLAKLRAGELVKIAFMGDSITLGAEATKWYEGDPYSTNGKTFRGRFISELRQRFPRAQITPIESFKGGSSISFAVEQMGTTVAPQKPDLVVVAFGANDVDSNVDRPAKTPVDVFGKQLALVADKAREWDGETILVTAFPLNPWLKNGAAQRQPQYNAALLTAAKNTGAAVADVYTAFDSLTARGIPTWSQLHNWKNHPGDVGHEVYAQTLLRLFPTEGAVAAAPVVNPVVAANPNAAQTEAIRFGLAQPTDIPGKWSAEAQPTPPLGEILRRPTPDRPVYGVYCWAEEYVQHRDFIRKVGWTSVRLGGPINDEALKMAAQDGIEVLVTFSGTLVGNRSKFDSDEAFISAYVGEVGKFLQRWGPSGTIFQEFPTLPRRPIRFIEVWNEPNFQYLDGKPSPPTFAELQVLEAERARLYGKLLSATYSAVKAKWPEVSVVGFGAGGVMKADGRFIAKAHELNPEVARSYDILSTHPYVPGVSPEANYVASWGQYSIADSLREIRAALQKHGIPEKPIWYSELNWEITHGTGGHYEGEGAPRGSRISPELQASYLTRGYAWALRLGVPRLHYMSLVDTDNVNSGFLNRDRTPRASARAIETMVKVMPRPKLLGAIRDGEDGTHIYRFAADFAANTPEEVVMAWRVSGPQDVEIAWPHPQVQITDLLGATHAFPVSGGKLKIQIGPAPLYLRSKH